MKSFSEFNRSVGANIRQLRLSLGIPQKDLAMDAGVEPTTFTQIEKGTAGIKAFHLKRVADALGVSVDMLMSGNTFAKDADIDLKLEHHNRKSNADMFYFVLGSNIRMLRKRAKITQNELSIRLHLTKSTIAHMEAGNKVIPVHRIMMIAKIFKCPIEKLLPSGDSLT